MNWHALFAALAEGKTVVVQTPEGGERLRVDRHAGPQVLMHDRDAGDCWLSSTLPSDISAFEEES